MEANGVRVAQVLENESQFFRELFGSDEQIATNLKAGARDAASDLGESAVTGLEIMGPFLVPPAARGASVAGKAAATAAERAMVRSATAAQNASFGRGIQAGMTARTIGAPTPQIPGNSTFNAGAKFGATLVDLGKAVIDIVD